MRKGAERLRDVVSRNRASVSTQAVGPTTRILDDCGLQSSTKAGRAFSPVTGRDPSCASCCTKDRAQMPRGSWQRLSCSSIRHSNNMIHMLLVHEMAWGDVNGQATPLRAVEDLAAGA